MPKAMRKITTKYQKPADQLSATKANRLKIVKQ